jgi:DNA-binding NarL/FixJ family response regulator
VKVIVAENQFFIKVALLSLLNGNEKYDVVDVVESRGELIKSLQKQAVAVVIMDFSLLDFNGITEFSDFRQKYPDVNILLLTNGLAVKELNEFSCIGIKNFLLKSADEDELFQALDCTVKGKKYYSDEILELLLDKSSKKATVSDAGLLTGSEMEIVKLIADGLTTKQIALHKHISFHTVMSHRKNIFRKLEVSSVSELIMYAIKAGWINNIEYYI